MQWRLDSRFSPGALSGVPSATLGAIFSDAFFEQGAPGITGTLAVTTQGGIPSADGLVVVQGTLGTTTSATPAFSGSVSGGPISGTMAITAQGGIPNASGLVVVQGSLGVSTSATPAISGGIQATGSMVISAQGATPAFIGTVSYAPVTGTMAITAQGGIPNAAGLVVVQGTLGASTTSTAAFSGVVAIQGSLAASTGATAAFTGNVALPPITGTMAITLAGAVANFSSSKPGTVLDLSKITFRKPVARDAFAQGRGDMEGSLAASVEAQGSFIAPAVANASAEWGLDAWATAEARAVAPVAGSVSMTATMGASVSSEGSAEDTILLQTLLLMHEIA